METFLELLSEVLKEIVREVSAYVIHKNVLENKKITYAIESRLWKKMELKKAWYWSRKKYFIGVFCPL